MNEELIELNKRLEFHQNEVNTIANRMIELNRLSCKPLFNVNDLINKTKIKIKE